MSLSENIGQNLCFVNICHSFLTSLHTSKLSISDATRTPLNHPTTRLLKETDYKFYNIGLVRDFHNFTNFWGITYVLWSIDEEGAFCSN